MKRAVLWLAVVALAVGLTVLAFLPAAWLGQVVESRTGGRLTLGDAQGTLWRGSAFIGGAPGAGGAVTPLLPGRFAWRLENVQRLVTPITHRGLQGLPGLRADVVRAVEAAEKVAATWA